VRFLIIFFLVLCLISVALTIFRAIVSSITLNARVNARRRPQDQQPPLERLVRDPVCGTYVAERTAIRAGDQFFCSEECRSKWRA
jgi:hypothetical protein